MENKSEAERASTDLTQRNDPVEWARRLTEVLVQTDTGTAEAALKIAGVLNVVRVEREGRLRAEEINRSFRSNLDAHNDDAQTMFNLEGGPPPKLVEGRFVMPSDRVGQRE